MNAYQEALKLASNTYRQKIEITPAMLPLADEMYVDAWRCYARASEKEGAFQILSRRLPQFWFPIMQGIAATDDYRAALRLGAEKEKLPGATGLSLTKAGELILYIHSCPVCSIPVLYTQCRDDFLTLFRALGMRHEPVEISETVGAAIISGINNWDRLRSLRQSFEAIAPKGRSWTEEFQHIKKHKELYQDGIILLSDGPYAGISAKQMGITEKDWLNISLKLRLEHECAHVLTKRLLKPATTSLLDELIADSIAIIRTQGQFRTDWLAYFWELENRGFSRRLKYYVSNVKTGKNEQTEVCGYLSDWILTAISKIERLNIHYGSDLQGQLALVSYLAKYSLDELGNGIKGKH